MMFSYRSVWSCCLLLGSALANAQDRTPSDFSAFVQSDLIYESNVFRLSDEDQAERILGTSEMSDRLLRLGGGLEVKKAISRQMLTGSLGIFRHQYDTFDFLNHTSGNASLGWDWLAGERMIGLLEYRYERRVQDFTESKLTELDERDDHSLRANMTYLFTRAWRLKLAALMKEQEHGLAEREHLNRTLNRGVAELRYFTPKRSFAGFRLALSDADFPNRESVDGGAVDNSYQESDIGLIFDWKLSSASIISGGVGQTEREYEEFGERDFSGATWRGAYEWRPKTRYRIKASLWRELEAYTDAVSSHVVESGFGVEASWSVTPVSTLSFNFASLERSFEGQPDVIDDSQPVRNDDVIRYGVTGEIEMHRSLTVNLGFLFEERDSNSDRWDFDCYTLELGVKAVFF